ncbi:hypothetical protein Syun_023720 [Stephania yunnanensis]|uniref:Uncharacterized protein n=1 Tax=Stephania yunnanensis TaxID=152371 RepID=A0AAP0FPZ5_9MAGN
MRHEGKKKIAVKVEIAVWTNYVYDEYEAMWRRCWSLRMRTEFLVLFLHLSAIDKLEKVMMSTSDLIGGSTSTGGDSCTICLEDLEIDSEKIILMTLFQLKMGCYKYPELQKTKSGE